MGPPKEKSPKGGGPETKEKETVSSMTTPIKTKTKASEQLALVRSIEQTESTTKEFVATNNNDSMNNNDSPSSSMNTILMINSDESKDFQLLIKERQELKNKFRKLQLEIDEKNEIIIVLKDELETTKEQQDKFARENIQLLKDSKRVKFLQDENDFLQDKLNQFDSIELELKKTKEKLSEYDYFKIRINELEEDKCKFLEEISNLEEKFKLNLDDKSIIKQLESELNKWKSFSHEVEVEKNLIQNKLLESIDQETKLTQTNKQIDDENKRLKLLIKNLEEKRDEEEALSQHHSINHHHHHSSDLKQLDLQNHSTSSSNIIITPETTESETQTDELVTISSSTSTDIDYHHDNKLNDNDDLSLKYKTVCDELESNRNLVSELRQDLACEKNLASKLAKQLTTFTKQIKSLDKHYFPIHDSSTTSLSKQLNNSQDNNKVNNEKESSPSKDFNQVLPISSQTTDEAIAKVAIVSKPSVSGNSIESTTTEISSKTFVAGKDERKSNPSNEELGNYVPVTTATPNAQAIAKATPGQQQINDQLQQQEQLRDNNQVPTIISSNGHVKVNPLSGSVNPCLPDSSSPPPSAIATPSNAADNNNNNDRSQTTKQKHRTPSKDSKSQPQQQPQPAISAKNDIDCDYNDDDGDDESDNLKLTRRSSELSKSGRSAAARTSQQKQQQYFVRNSMPSRSVNYGTSKSSYLDSIRASVIATTSTETSSSSTFNEQSKLNLSQPQRPSNSVLNCMLDHQHSQRCYLIDNGSRQLATNLLQQQQQLVNSINPVVSSVHNVTMPLQSSAQLNALIDPVSNSSREQLMLSLLQQQHHHARHHHQNHNHHNPIHPHQPLQHTNQQHLAGEISVRQQQHHHNMQYQHHHLHQHQSQSVCGGITQQKDPTAELTDQQIAQLASLHQQHYYHHLQHMHQLHQLHHQHHLLHQQHRMQHHKYAGDSESATAKKTANPTANKQATTAEAQQQTALRLHQSDPVYTGGSQFYAPGSHHDQVYANLPANNKQEPTPRQPPTKLIISPVSSQSPSRQQRPSPQKSSYALPQIDEIKDLTLVNDSSVNSSRRGTVDQQTSPTIPRVLTGSGATKTAVASSGSPNSPSPTSSTSSNLSATSSASSSASSSGTSLNSFTGPPMNRTQLRHTATEVTRRQFSVERDLVGATPLTATLSRVGSCRATAGRVVSTSVAANRSIDSEAAIMRNNHQSRNQMLGIDRRLSLDPRIRVQPEVSEKLASNLANIKLDDRLAFTSLRANKGITNNLVGIKNQGGPSSRATNIDFSQSATSTPGKPTSMEKTGSVTSSSAKKAVDGAAPGKSSVWFEYGCV